MRTYIYILFPSGSRRLIQEPFRAKDQEYGYEVSSDSKMSHVSYCKDLLPQKCQLADPAEPVACRLFVVSNPTPFDENILTDIFCRFGDCIDAYFLQRLYIMKHIDCV